MDTGRELSLEDIQRVFETLDLSTQERRDKFLMQPEPSPLTNELPFSPLTWISNTSIQPTLKGLDNAEL